MNIDFELYRIFYVVANHGNITKAAEELNISQPAISKSIKNLEEQLGGQLFVRTKRGVILTEEGKEFYHYIKQAVECIRSAENKFIELMNLESGNIKIGISSTLAKQFLLPHLEEFHKTYPKINIQIFTYPSIELISKLRNGFIDMAILNIYEKQSTDDIEIIKCKEINDCFIASPSYLELKDKLVSLKDLNNYPLILQVKGSNARDFLDDFAKKEGIVLNPNMEVASYSLVTAFTKMGLGIGYTTKEYITKELEKKELIVINLKEKIPSRYIGIILSKNHLTSFSTKKMVETIVNGEDNV